MQPRDPWVELQLEPRWEHAGPCTVPSTLLSPTSHSQLVPQRPGPAAPEQIITKPAKAAPTTSTFSQALCHPHCGPVGRDPGCSHAADGARKAGAAKGSWQRGQWAACSAQEATLELHFQAEATRGPEIGRDGRRMPKPRAPSSCLIKATPSSLGFQGPC